MSLIRKAAQFSTGWGLTLSVATTSALSSVVSGGRARRSVTPAMLRFWGRGMLRAAGVTLEIEGLEHLEGQKARVVTFNHTSLLDAYIVTVLMPDAGTFAVKSEADGWPVIGRSMRALGFVLLNRKNSDAARKTMKEALARMRVEKLTVFIAPEGTRSLTGELLHFHRGAHHLAVDAGVPIVPVVIKGAYELQPSGQLTSKPGVVKIRVLPPVPLTWTHDTAGEAADELREVYKAELQSMG